MRTSALKLMRNPGLSESTGTGSDQFDQPLPEKPAEKPVFETPIAANDPFLGLVSGDAPDPSTEIPYSSEPDTPVTTDDGPSWQPKVLDLESAREETGSRYLDVDAAGGTATISNMAEEDFIEFWAVDVWETISIIGGMPFLRLDLKELETAPEEMDQARKAAKHLYKMAQRHPKWLGWMISESTLNGGDFIMCAAFFGGKGYAIVAAIQERKREWQEKKRAKQRYRPDKSKPVIDGEVEHV